MKSHDFQRPPKIPKSFAHITKNITAPELERAEFTLLMILDLPSPERERQFLNITLALQSGRIKGGISSMS